ncbi:hypothetical protein GCM10025859_60840 [Alicyclobacillus fastidiosus]|nr:hypothetical protein GCM10025859_60840 [Alicyclobacillus fastidiosus]
MDAWALEEVVSFAENTLSKLAQPPPNPGPTSHIVPLVAFHNRRRKVGIPHQRVSPGKDIPGLT